MWNPENLQIFCMNDNDTSVLFSLVERCNEADDRNHNNNQPSSSLQEHLPHRRTYVPCETRTCSN